MFTPLERTHVTPRQSEILELIAAGLADKEIAERLGLSYGTVRTQLGRFFAANGVRGRAGAAALWVRTNAPDTQRPSV
jgi:DNA-binding CsgD family transcriptional regulator